MAGAVVAAGEVGRRWVVADSREGAREGREVVDWERGLVLEMEIGSGEGGGRRGFSPDFFRACYRTRGGKGRTVFFGCVSRMWAELAIFGLLQACGPRAMVFVRKEEGIEGGRTITTFDPPLIVKM